MITKSSSKTVFALFVGVAMFAACGKSSPSPGSTRIMYTNGSVGASSTSLSVNGSNLSNTGSIAYLSSSGYQSVASGSATITSALNGVGVLGKLTATLNANTSYSVFDCGTVLADTLVLITDAFPSNVGNYAYARVVNVSSDTTATAITGVVGNAVVGSDVGYGAASAFTQLTPGSYTVTAFNVAKPGNVATLSTMQFSAGRIYTLLYSGNSSTSVGFKVTVIGNN